MTTILIASLVTMFGAGFIAGYLFFSLKQYLYKMELTRQEMLNTRNQGYHPNIYEADYDN